MPSPKSKRSPKPRAVRRPAPAARVATRREPVPEPLPPPPAVVKTEGQRLLLAVPGTLQMIGDAVGATKVAVCRWRSGERLPAASQRTAIEAQLGITADAWNRTPANADPSPGDQLDDDPDDDQGDDDDPDALQDVGRLLRMLRRQLNRTNLTALERKQLGDSFGKTLAQKERLERARELLEGRTVRDHPKWKELRAAIRDALLPHKEAHRDFEAAVMRVLGRDADND